jgi:hypothetical protein
MSLSYPVFPFGSRAGIGREAPLDEATGSGGRQYDRRQVRRGGSTVADADDVRRIALGLPHVVEIDSDGFDFRVGNKGFVWSYPERVPGRGRVIRTDIAVLYVGDEAEKQALLLGEPELFGTAPGYDGWPLVLLRLDRVDVTRLAELITDARHMRAPAHLLS